jgi:hypothetical protein
MSNALLRLECGAVLLMLAVAAAAGPYYIADTSSDGWQVALLVLVGAALAAVAVSPAADHVYRLAGALPGKFTCAHIAAGGVLAQLAVAVITQPTPVSDGRAYLSLAHLLATQLHYADETGGRAFWPPGLPLFLSPFVALLGPGLPALTAANIVLYLLGLVALWTLARALFDARVAALSALLFTLWPSRLLTAALASKENLTIAMMLCGLALCVLAYKRGTVRPWRYALGAGVAFGVAALAQPGLLLFTPGIPLCYRYAAGMGVRRFVGLWLLTLCAAMLTLAPWHARNCMLFDGQFCGLATNGGSVFYRANNPLATGGWTPEGEIRITHLPELEQNRLGFEYGKQWIRENPGDFAMLAVRKFGQLIRDDRYGAYWAILRAASQVDARRQAWFHAANIVSWLFWMLIICCVARALASGKLMRADRLPLLYPLLYSAVVFAVFESDRRQHMIALALLIVLASAWMLDRQETPA